MNTGSDNSALQGTEFRILDYSCVPKARPPKVKVGCGVDVPQALLLIVGVCRNSGMSHVTWYMLHGTCNKQHVHSPVNTA